MQEEFTIEASNELRLCQCNSWCHKDNYYVFPLCLDKLRAAEQELSWRSLKRLDDEQKKRTGLTAREPDMAGPLSSVHWLHGQCGAGAEVVGGYRWDRQTWATFLVTGIPPAAANNSTGFTPTLHSGSANRADPDPWSSTIEPATFIDSRSMVNRIFIIWPSIDQGRI